MSKLIHEVRDGVHGLVQFDQIEKRLIDSAPMQRLRCIHQLAMCYQVYPGATHKRFEHSLGVMEVAGRIFDRLFGMRLPDPVQSRIADELQAERRSYWRRVVRLAGLLHDLGHLPFSHAAEKDLLPEGWDHEVLTAIRSAVHGDQGRLTELAKRVLSRQHFRTIFELVSTHKRKRPTILDELIKMAEVEFGKEKIRSDHYGPRTEVNEFLVQTADGRIETSCRFQGSLQGSRPLKSD